MKFYVFTGGDHDDGGAEEAHVLVGVTMKMMEVQSKKTLVPLMLFFYNDLLIFYKCVLNPSNNFGMVWRFD